MSLLSLPRDKQPWLTLNDRLNGVEKRITGREKPNAGRMKFLVAIETVECDLHSPSNEIWWVKHRTGFQNILV